MKKECLSCTELASSFLDAAKKSKELINKFDKKRQHVVFRLIYGKIYYALYHKYLATDSGLRRSEQPKKHKLLIEDMEKKYANNDIVDIYKKFRTLRIWADYKYEYGPDGQSLDINSINKIEMSLCEANEFFDFIDKIIKQKSK